MRAKILIDNVTKDELIPEWGLSIYLEYGGRRFLLDTGASDQFLANARNMGIDLTKVEFGVLSHAHYDHADGIGAFFEANSQAPFYLRKGAEENCYSRKKYLPRYIGIQKGLLAAYADRILFAEGDLEIGPGITLLPHKTAGLEKIGRKIGMYVRKGLWMRPDCFSHEQSLVLETGKGLVILNSCSHGGADNIIREVEETWPEKQIYAYIGGLHLYRRSPEDVRALAAQIKKTGIGHIYTGHCTGDGAFEILKEELGERVQQIYTGMEIVIDEATQSSDDRSESDCRGGGTVFP